MGRRWKRLILERSAAVGVNICIKKPETHEDHPDWSWFRMAGDRQFAAMVPELPLVAKGEDGDEWLYVRPADFRAWRNAIAKVEWANPGRYDGMLDILERDSDYWIYLSY